MVCGEGCRALVPSECPPFCSTSPHLPSVTHLKPPWMPYYAVCVEAPSHRQDLFLSPFSAMLPSQENCGGGAENPKHLIMACSFQWPFLSQDPPRVALLERKTLLSSSKWKGFQELCQGWGQRPNIRTKDVPNALIIQRITKFHNLCAGTMGRDQYIFSYIYGYPVPLTICWIVLTPSCVLLISFMKINWPYILESISRLSILFHWPMSLFRWQYHCFYYYTFEQ